MKEELTKSEDKFRMIFNKSRDEIFIHEINGNFIEVNQMACEMLEYSHEELLQMGPEDIDDPENAKKVGERTIHVSKEKSCFFETTQLSKSGKLIFVEVNSVLIDYFGRPAILSIARDITERKKLTSELTRNIDVQNVINILLKEALTAIPLDNLLIWAIELIVSIPWLAIEKKGAILLTNEEGILEMKAHYGLSKHITKTCKNVYPGKCICGIVLETKKQLFVSRLDHQHSVLYTDIKDHGHYCVPILYSGKVLGVLNTYIAKDHAYSEFEINFLVTVANTLAGIIIRKKAEIELQNMNEVLEAKITERTAELATINEKLNLEIAERQRVIEKEKELNMLKSRFISVVSHEFRTPLTGIYTSVQLFERYGNKWDDDKKQQFYKDIYKSVGYTNMLLEDVSLIGRDDSGKLPFNANPVFIEAVCFQAIKDIKAFHGELSDINFISIPESIEAIADESILRHILNNLLSNAVKYSEQGGQIEFIVKLQVDNIVFTIADHGIGIPKKDLKYIFETFQRASNVGTTRGTGLGLSIVKRCVKLHNGTIKIKSKLNSGTTVIVSIPYIKPSS